MLAEVEEHLAEVETFYRPVLFDGSRLTGAAKLWRQYEDARDTYRRGATDFLSVYERINEMAAAQVLLADTTLTDATIAYETPIAADGSLIDFTASWSGGRTLYVEVKTVHPRTQDTKASWDNFVKRSAHHPEQVTYAVHKDWLGGQLYGDAFSARASFLKYSRQFEERLAAATAVRPGEGVLLVCGTGFRWHRDELEDFADFYRLGVHREDDPFAKMEAHNLVQGSIELMRNIRDFGYIKRAMDHVAPQESVPRVQGPVEGRGR